MKKYHQYILLFILLFGLVCFLFSKLIFGAYLFISSDTLAPQAFKQSILNIKNNYGYFSYWFPYIFSGMPTIHSFIGIHELYLPHHFIDSLFNIFNIPWSWNFFIHYIFAGFGMYLLIQYFNQSKLSSIFGSVLFMLNPYMVAYYVHGHGGQMMTACYIPWIMLFLLRAYEKNDFLNYALLALMIGLQLQRGHIQIAYYTWLMMGLYILIDFIINIRSFKNISYISLFKKKMSIFFSLLLGLLFSFNIYYPVMNYTPLSIRGMESGGFGLEKATMWSFSFNEFITLILPYYYGFGGQLYSGYMPFTDFPNYIGIIILLLSVFGLYKSNINKKYKIFFIAVVAISLLLSTGKYFINFYSLFYNYLPYFDKFRAPVFILILLYFCCSILASFGLNVILAQLKDKNQFLNILSVLFIILISCFYFKFFEPSYYPKHKIENNKEFIEIRKTFLKDAMSYSYDFNNDSKMDYRDNLILDHYLNNDAKVFYLSQYLINDNNNDGKIDKTDIQNIESMQIVSILKIIDDNVELYSQSYNSDINIIITLLFIIIVLFFLYGKNSFLPGNYLIISIIVICIFDYYRINSEIINTKNHIPNKHILKSKDYLDKYLSNDEIVDFLKTDNDKYRILDLTGSDPNRWAAFNIETIEGYHPAKLNNYNEFIRNNKGYDYSLLYTANVKYIISRQKYSNNYVKKMKMYYFGNDSKIDGKLIDVYVYKIDDYYPRMFFVENVVFDNSFDSILNKVKNQYFDPKKTAYLDTSGYSNNLITQLNQIKYNPLSSSQIKNWSPDEITININSSSSQFLFLSEVFYPGWETNIDSEILTVNGLFRGLVVPKGNYDLIIKFNSNDILFGYTFHLIAFVLILILLLLHKFYRKNE